MFNVFIIGVLFGIAIGAGAVATISAADYESGYRAAINEMFSKRRRIVISHPVNDDALIHELKYGIDKTDANKIEDKEGDLLESILHD